MKKNTPPSDTITKPRSNKYITLLVIFSFVAGVVISLFYSQLNRQVNENIVIKQEPVQNTSSYTFINPSLSCSGNLSETKNFKEDISNYISQAKSLNKATRISVRYRDLNNGYQFELNGNEKYFPASLMKVFTMMLLLKKEMATPGFLETKVFFNPTKNDSFKNEHHLKPGSTYTIKMLLENMIKHSDNMSTLLLHDYTTLSELTKFYKEIDLLVPHDHVNETHQLEDFIEIAEYSKVFRILYNSAYLNKELSNYALKLLSETHFDKALTAGLPAGFYASHKYGVWKKGGKTQLHDCGIIYHNNEAYMLAVMTEGSNEYVLAEVIKTISQMVSSKVDIKIKNELVAQH